MFHKVICHTSKCANENILITILDPTEFIVCGPCGNEITDKNIIEPVILPSGNIDATAI